jgi:hypothetical protein
LATAYDGGLSGQNAGTHMPKEFEKLAALLDGFQPSERTPLIDRVEATKLAARWGRMPTNRTALAISSGFTIAIVGLSLASVNPDYEGLSMQNERTIDDGPSLRAVTAKIKELLAANPKATDKAKFKMLSNWLEHNLEHQKSVNAYFLTATHHLPFVPPTLPTAEYC